MRKWLSLAALALVVILAGCSSGPTVTTPTRTATATIQPSPTTTPPPTTVYVGNGQNVFALNATTGAMLWTYKTGVGAQANYSVGALTLAGDKLLFLNGADQSLYALSAAIGALLWKVSGVAGSGQNNGYIVVDGNLAIASTTVLQAYNATVAVDLASGKAVWKQPMGQGQIVVGNGALYEARSLPGSDAEPVTNGYDQAINPATGAVIWNHTGSTALGNLMLIGSTLYGAHGDTLVGLNPQTGEQVWSQPFPNPTTQYPPALSLVANGTTIYVANGAKLTALDGTSHQVLWQTPTATFYDRFTNGTLCIGFQGLSGNSGVAADDASTGTQLWRATGTQTGIYTSLLADNSLCVEGMIAGGNSVPPTMPLTALDARTGAVRWSVTVGTADVAAIPAGDALYCLSDVYQENGPSPNSILRAISEADGAVLWQFDTGDNNMGSVVVR